MAKFIKVMAVVFLVLGLGLSVSAGEAFRLPVEDSYYSTYTRTEYNWQAAAIGGMGSVFVFCVLGGIGWLLAAQDRTNELMWKLGHQLAAAGSKGAARQTEATTDEAQAPDQAPDQAAATDKPAQKDASVVPAEIDAAHLCCPVCGTVQSVNRNRCWDCGSKFDRSADAKAEQCDPDHAPIKPTAQDNEHDQCPLCSMVQPAGRTSCCKCGVKFER